MWFGSFRCGASPDYRRPPGSHRMTQPLQRERARAITSRTFADELMPARQRAVLLTGEYNASCGQPAADRESILRRLLRQARSGAYFEPDLHCEFGYNVTLGDGFSAKLRLRPARPATPAPGRTARALIADTSVCSGVERLVCLDEPQVGEPHDQARARGRAAQKSHAERPARQGCYADKPPGFVAASGPDRECVALATCPHDDGLAEPLRQGGDRPVRDTPRDDCSQLQDAVGQLDAGLDPLLRVGTDQQARLIELGREVSDEPDLSGRPVGEVGEQGVACVVDEAVGGGSPQVAAPRRGDQQVVLVPGDLRGWVQPIKVPPTRTPPVSRSSIGHGINLPTTAGSRGCRGRPVAVCPAL